MSCGATEELPEGATPSAAVSSLLEGSHLPGGNSRTSGSESSLPGEAAQPGWLGWVPPPPSTHVLLADLDVLLDEQRNRSSLDERSTVVPQIDGMYGMDFWVGDHVRCRKPCNAEILGINL